MLMTSFNKRRQLQTYLSYQCFSCGLGYLQIKKRQFFIISCIFTFFILLFESVPMIKDCKTKKQVMEDKIQSKCLNFKQEEERLNRFDQQDCYAGFHDQEQQKSQDYEQCMNNYMKAMNDLNDYIVEEGNNGDGEYTHKLLFDFYKYQAIFYNMDEDEEVPEVYSKFVKPQVLEKKEGEEGSPVFQEIENDNHSFKEMERRMSMKDKLQMGKFCFYDRIPTDNQIEEYKSISSEEQILQRDSLSDLFERLNNKSQMSRIKYLERKQKEKEKKQNDKVKKMLRNTRYSEEYLENQLNQIEEDEEQLNRKIFKMQEREKVAKKIKEEHLRRQKAKSRPHNKLINNEQEDSSNQVHFDSQESDDQSEDGSEEEGSDEQGNYNDQEDILDKQQEHFKHLDRYEQILDFGDGDEFEFTGGKQKIIRGVEQYHSMKKNEKDRYFRKMFREYEDELKKQQNFNRKKRKENKKFKTISKKKRVSFSDSIFYKNFNSNAKPCEVKLTDQKQEIVIKAIWEYDD